MLRFIVIVIFVVSFLILSTPIMLLFGLIGKKNPALKDRYSKSLISWAFRCVAFLSATKLNHRSFYDIVLTCFCFPGITGYVAKKEMNKWPLLNIWMRYIHCLFLDRDNIKEGLKTILAGIEKLKSGISLCIFPEGTRNKVNDTMLTFHEGSFKLADKSGAPIIPMTIVNSAAVFEDHLPKVKPATVVIDFGEPIYIKNLDKDVRKSLGTYVSDIILKRYFELKEECNIK